MSSSHPPQAPVDAPSPGRAIPWIWMLLPLVASALVRDLWAPDEPRYAEVAREAWGEGGLLVMHLCGAVYPDKPPLVYWLSGLFGTLFGWHGFWLRLPSLLATAGTAWLVARLARRWWGRTEASWAPVLFLGTAMVTEIGGRLQLDPVLAFLCVLALTLLDAPASSLTERRRQLFLVAVVTGLAALTKGPVAYLHVGLPWLLWWGLLRRHDPIARSRPAVGRPVVIGVLLGAVLVPLVWALAASLAEPALFKELFYGQHVGRVARGVQHGGPFYKHLTRIPLMLLPWTPVMFMGFYGALKAWARRNSARELGGLDLGLVKGGLWFLAMFIFFSSIGPKRDLYLLPAYPAAALLGARAWTQCLARRRATPGAQFWLAVPLFALLGLVLAVAPLVVEIPPLIEGMAWRGPLAALPFLLGARWMFGARADGTSFGRRLLWSWCIAASVLAVAIFPAMNPVKSGRTLGALIAARPEQPLSIPCEDLQPEAFRFYAGVPTTRERLAPVREREGKQFLGLVTRRRWDKMSADDQASYAILFTRPIGRREVLVLGAAGGVGVR